MIKQETIDQVIATAPVEEVIGEYVHLKKRGVNFIGLCPFHDEKTPSFNVSPVKNIYKCFGCGKGGDVIRFMMEHEKYSYPEAIRFLAQKYNIPVLEDGQQYSEEEKDERESLYIVMNFAKQYYHNLLLESDEGKSIGLSYFYERGFKDSTVQAYELGWSPSGRSTFSDHALKSSYSKEVLLKAGLSFETKDGSLMDRFRERVMFPIHSISGRAIGFGGRTLKTKSKEAKYINTPETDIYHKSRILYGISQARKAIREQDGCLLVEGYTDVLSLFQKGILNVVASSGTSLTEEQVRLIKRYTENVTLLFDGDAAGTKAALRGIDIVLQGGLNVKTVILPEGEDPDSFARAHKQEEIEKFVSEKAEDFVLFKAKLLLGEKTNDPLHKAQVTKDIVTSIAQIPDQLKRSIFVKEAGRLLEIDEQVLYAELNKTIAQKYRKGWQKPADEEAAPPPEPDEKEAAGTAASVSIDLSERTIISLVLKFGTEVLKDDVKVADYVFQEIGTTEWSNTNYQEMVEEYLQMQEKNEAVTLNQFLHHKNQELQQLSVDLLGQKYTLSPRWKEIAGKDMEAQLQFYYPQVMGCMRHLKMKKLLNLIIENQEEIKKAEKEGDEEELTELLEVQKHLNDLKKEIGKELGMVVVR